MSLKNVLKMSCMFSHIHYISMKQLKIKYTIYYINCINEKYNIICDKSIDKIVGKLFLDW